MKKIIKNKNRKVKIVNNHKIKIYHKNKRSYHIVSKDWAQIYESLSPIYHDLDNEYSSVDLIDLIFYERWLNG